MKYRIIFVAALVAALALGAAVTAKIAAIIPGPQGVTLAAVFGLASLFTIAIVAVEAWDFRR